MRAQANLPVHTAPELYIETVCFAVFDSRLIYNDSLVNTPLCAVKVALQLAN